MVLCLQVFVVQLVRYWNHRQWNNLIHSIIILFVVLAFFNRTVALTAGVAYRAALDFFETLCWAAFFVFALWLSVLAWIKEYDYSYKSRVAEKSRTESLE
jgi:hypothetical protein